MCSLCLRLCTACGLHGQEQQGRLDSSLLNVCMCYVRGVSALVHCFCFAWSGAASAMSFLDAAIVQVYCLDGCGPTQHY
jgi:hypothetical protein